MATERIEMLTSEKWVVFVSTSEPVLAEGEAQDYGVVDTVRGWFSKKAEDVEADFKLVASQISKMIEHIPNPAGDFEMSQIDIGLGFSASGKLAFIAEASAEASVKIVFKRRPSAKT